MWRLGGIWPRWARIAAGPCSSVPLCTSVASSAYIPPSSCSTGCRWVVSLRVISEDEDISCRSPGAAAACAREAAVCRAAASHPVLTYHQGHRRVRGRASGLQHSHRATADLRHNTVQHTPPDTSCPRSRLPPMPNPPPPHFETPTHTCITARPTGHAPPSLLLPAAQTSLRLSRAA